MKKNILGLIFLLIGLVFLLASFSSTITGNAIVQNLSDDFSLFQIIGIVFLFISIIFFVSRQSLDVIIIPKGENTEVDIERANKGVKERHTLRNKGYFLISGEIKKSEKGNRSYKGSRAEKVYNELRNYGIDSSKIKIEPKSRNTIENVLYSLGRIEKRGGIDIGIVSYPGHLDRFEDIIKRGKKEGVINKNIRIHRIQTRDDENLKEKTHELLSRILNKYKLRKGVKEALNSEDDLFVKNLKKAGRSILKLVR